MALERIIPRTRADLEVRMAQTPLQTLKSRCTQSTRSFYDALAEPRTGFIMECKKASPSRGLIRPDFDVREIARAYAPVADAVSVLTDSPFFQGSRSFLQIVAEESGLPVLCKDFVVDPYQIYEARAHGAHAVLLMLSVLDDVTYRACAEVVASLGMHALTEVHDLPELERALSLNAPIIGINNRNLKTLEVDLDVTRALAPLVPEDRIVVCESGVFTHEQVRQLRPYADAFLVGTSLMQQPDVLKAAKTLAFGRVKVCGLTRARDAHAVHRHGGVLGGLIFAESSPRFVTDEQAQSLVSQVPALDWVGVFVNASIERVVERAQSLKLYAVQLHGEEDPEYIAELKTALGDAVEIWRAHRVKDAITDITFDTTADRILLDTFRAGQRGGTGDVFDWSLIPQDHRQQIVLSGGLNPELASDADSQSVWALDANSGLESSPGVKNDHLIHQFFQALRGASARPDVASLGEDS